MDEELDALLARSAPPTAHRSHRLTTATAAVVAAAEPGRGRARRRVGIAGLAAIAILGGGVAAVQSSGWYPVEVANWTEDRASIELDLTLPDGTVCPVTYELVPSDTAAGQYRYSHEQWSRAWRITKEFVASVDPATLDTPAIRARVMRETRAAEERMRRINPPEEWPPVQTEVDVILAAPVIELHERLGRHLELEGLSREMITTGLGHRCESELFR